MAGERVRTDGEEARGPGDTGAGTGQPATAGGATGTLLTGPFLRLTVANFLFFMTFATFFLLPVRIRQLGGSDGQVGLVMGMNGVAGLAGVFLVGALIDRVGCRVFLRAGMVGMAVLALAFSRVEAVGPLMMLLRALQGLAFAAGFNASSTLAAAFAPPERRANALGLFGVSTLATHALAPTIGERIYGAYGFPALFALASLFALAGLGIAWSLPEPRSAHAGDRAAPRSRLSPPLRSALLVTGLCGLAFGAVMTFVPTFALDERLGPVATFFLSYTSAAILVRVGAGRIADDVGVGRMIPPAIALLSAAIASLCLVHSRLALGLSGVAFGLAQGVVYPTLNAYSVGLAPQGELGRVQAFFNGAFNVGVTSGSLALGAVAHAFGHRATFAAASTTALLALLAFLGGTRTRRPAP